MTTTTRTETNNINIARPMANRFAKAQNMTQEGYEFEQATIDGNRLDHSFMVRTPEGRFHCCNIETKTCTCEDYKKHSEPCKHVLWAEMKVDEMDTASMEAQCAEYDARQEFEEGGQDVCPCPSLTVKDVRESLQMRMVADLERTEARIRDTRYPHSSDVERRQSTLTCALEIIGEYWSKEYVGRLDLQPASK